MCAGVVVAFFRHTPEQRDAVLQELVSPSGLVAFTSLAYVGSKPPPRDYVAAVRTGWGQCRTILAWAEPMSWFITIYLHAVRVLYVKHVSRAPDKSLNAEGVRMSVMTSLLGYCCCFHAPV